MESFTDRLDKGFKWKWVMACVESLDVVVKNLIKLKKITRVS